MLGITVRIGKGAKMSVDKYKSEFEEALIAAVGEKHATKLVFALEQWIGAEKDDLKDRIRQSGRYDSFY